jgi:uncharacterized protein (DUF3084 family)
MTCGQRGCEHPGHRPYGLADIERMASEREGDTEVIRLIATINRVAGESEVLLDEARKQLQQRDARIVALEGEIRRRDEHIAKQARKIKSLTTNTPPRE